MPLILSPEMSLDEQLQAIVTELAELDAGLGFAIRYARLSAHALCTRSQLVETDIQCEEWERKRIRPSVDRDRDTDPPRTDPVPGHEHADNGQGNGE